MVLKRKVNNFDTQILRLELYRLLCYFVASEGIANKTEISNLVGEFQDDQITIGLISIASMIRIIDDRNKRYLEKYKNKTICGYLIDKNNKKIELNLRMACNKILHANQIKFDILSRDNTMQIKPKINLYGKEASGSEWMTKIDIFKFVDVINGYVLLFF